MTPTQRTRNKHSSHVLRRRLRHQLTFITQTLLIVAVCAFLAWLAFSPLFKIKHLSCQLNGQACRTTHLDQLETLKGKHSLLTKPGQIENQLLQSDPLLSTAKVKLLFPDKLSIKLTSQSETLLVGLIPYTPSDFASDPASDSSSPPGDQTPPVATPSGQSTQATPSAQPTPPNSLLNQKQAISSTTPQLKTLTASGRLIPAPDSPPSPPSAFLLSSPSTNLLKNFYHLYQELILSGINPQTIWLYQSNAAIRLPNRLLVHLSLTKPIETSIATLQQIRSQSTINLNQVIIDLRFTKPVVSNY